VRVAGTVETNADRRVLVQVVALAEHARPRERWVYRSVERGAEAVARRYLGSQYRHRILLRDTDATPRRVLAALETSTAAPGVEAVDLLVQPHGTSRRLMLADGPIDTDDLAARAQARLAPAQRRRLRVVLSTACFGVTHNDAWLRCGFAAAAGARGVYADGLTSVPAMLRAWAAGATVQEAVDAANGAGSRRLQDAVAAHYYRHTGRQPDADAVDSERLVDGARGMTIGTDPASWRPRSLPA